MDNPREDCLHCHVLSHSSLDLCPHCGLEKDVTYVDSETDAETVNDVAAPEYVGQFTATTDQVQK